MRWSVAALLGLALALWAQTLAGGALVGSPPVLLVVAGAALVAGLRTPWPAALLGGAAAVVVLAVADQVGEGRRFSLANDLVFYAVVALGPLLVGLVLAARNRQIARLQAQRRVLEERHRLVALAARTAEAERVGSAVDRALGEQLVVLVAAARDAERHPERLAVVERSARASLDQLRTVLGALHEPDPAPPRPAPPLRRPAVTRGPVDLLLLLSVLPLAVETAASAVGPGRVVGTVVASLAQGLALVLCRRRVLAGALVLLAVALLQTALLAPLPPTVSWLVPGLLLAFLVGAAPRRTTARAGLVLTLAGAAALPWATPGARRDLADLVPGLVLGVLAWTGGRVLAGRDARARELRAIADELARTEEAAAHLAATSQRVELARELHDVGAHALTVACLQAGAAQTWHERDPARAAQAVAALQELAAGPLAALGESLTGLGRRPDATGLLDVVVGLGRVLGLRVEVVVVGRARAVPETVTAVACRVVQEALTNAARHAPGSEVTVELTYDDGSLRVRVRDFGLTDQVAPALAGAGLGLRGMRERVAAVRGELVTGPATPGFEVRATLPA